MKKIKRSLAVLAAVTILSSCGGKSFQDVEIKDLETVCDCGEAIALGLMREMEFKDNPLKYTPNPGEESPEINDWEAKMKEVGDYCTKEKGFSRTEIGDCPAMQEVKKEMDKIK